MFHPDVSNRTLIDNDDFQDIFKPIEIAAMVQNRAAVEILFSVTEQLAHYPTNWSVDSLMEAVHLEGFQTMVEATQPHFVLQLNLQLSSFSSHYLADG